MMTSFASVREHVADGAGTEALAEIEDSVARISELFGSKIKVDRSQRRSATSTSSATLAALPEDETAPDPDAKPTEADTAAGDGDVFDDAEGKLPSDGADSSVDAPKATDESAAAEKDAGPNAEQLAAEKEAQLEHAKADLERLVLDLEKHRAIIALHENIAAIAVDRKAADAARDAAVAIVEQFKKDHPGADAERCGPPSSTMGRVRVSAWRCGWSCARCGCTDMSLTR